MGLRIDDVRAFVEVVRASSFSEAARRISLTPSGLARAVDRLEAAVGGRLLQRSTRALSLTPEGDRMLPHAHRLLEEATAAEQAVGGIRGRVSGILRVTASATLARLYLAPVFRALVDRHPDLDLDLHLVDRNVDVRAEGLDAAIRAGPLGDSNLRALRIAPERRLVCAAPKYLEARGRLDHPADLKNHRCIIMPGQNVWTFRGRGPSASVRVPATVRADLGDFAVEAAIAGLGVTRVSDWRAGPALADGRLERLLIPYEPASVGHVALLYPSHHQRTPRVRALLDVVRDTLIPAPWTAGVS